MAGIGDYCLLYIILSDKATDTDDEAKISHVY